MRMNVRFYLSYDTKIIWNLIFGMKMLRFHHNVRNNVKDVIT